MSRSATTARTSPISGGALPAGDSPAFARAIPPPRTAAAAISTTTLDFRTAAPPAAAGAALSPPPLVVGTPAPPPGGGAPPWARLPGSDQNPYTGPHVRLKASERSL